MRKVIQTAVSANEQNGDEGGNPAYSVGLSLVPTDLLQPIYTGYAKHDYHRQYSTGLVNFQITSTNYSVEAVINNLGEVDASLAYLWIVLWTQSGLAKVKRFGSPFSVPKRGNTTRSHSGLLAEFGLAPTDTVTNAFVAVCDPFMDKFEGQLDTFIKQSLNGTIDVSINPCRFSKKIIGRWSLQNQPFTRNGNVIKSQCAYADVVFMSRDASGAAYFGYYDEQGARIEITGNLINTQVGSLLATVMLPETNSLRFFLRSVNGMKESTNSGTCRMEHFPGIIRLEWEDSSDGDFNDFVIHIIYR